MDVLKKSDFPDIIADKFFGESSLTSDRAEELIVEQFEKGKTTEEIFLNGINALDRLEKGKRGSLGEVRTWGGNKYQKTAEGWKPFKEGGSKPSSEIELHNAKEELDRAKELYHHTPSAEKRKALDEAQKRYDSTLSKKETSTETKATEPKQEVKVSDFGIAGKVGGGYRATGVINGKKMGVDIPADMIRGVANFEGKELRQKIKAHLAEKGEEIVTGKVSKEESEFSRVQQDLNEKVNSLSLLTKDGWEESWSRNVRSKSYGGENFVKSMSVRVEGDFVKKETYFTVDCGYSKSPEYGEEADKYYSQLTSLKDKKFSTAREAAKAADKFAEDWNKEK